jgi:hypothetical protein
VARKAFAFHAFQFVNGGAQAAKAISACRAQTDARAPDSSDHMKIRDKYGV